MDNAIGLGLSGLSVAKTPTSGAPSTRFGLTTRGRPRDLCRYAKMTMWLNSSSPPKPLFVLRQNLDGGVYKPSFLHLVVWVPVPYVADGREVDHISTSVHN